MRKLLLICIIVILATYLIACNLTNNSVVDNSDVNESSNLEKIEVSENKTVEKIEAVEEIEVPSTDGAITTVAMKNDSYTPVGDTIATIPDRLKDLAEDDKIANKQLGRDYNATVSFTPTSVTYNDSGQLIATGMLTNLTEVEISPIRVRELSLYNEDNELIASECFGYIMYTAGYLILKPEESKEWTLTFPKMMVKIHDDDLNHIVSDFRTSSAAHYYKY